MAWGSMGFAFAVLAFFTLPHYRQGESSVAGKTAENFAMDLDGKPAHLSDLRNKVVVLNFWASWCGPCVEETPSLIALQQRIASRNGVVLGVSVDEDPGGVPKIYPRPAPELSDVPRSIQEDRHGLRHFDVAGDLHHRSQGRDCSQDHRAAGLELPGTAGLF